MKVPEPVTREQQFLSAIYEEQKQIRQLLESLFGESEGIECDVCHKPFRNQRALNAHMKAHKGM